MPQYILRSNVNNGVKVTVYFTVFYCFYCYFTSILKTWIAISEDNNKLSKEPNKIWRDFNKEYDNGKKEMNYHQKS